MNMQKPTHLFLLPWLGGVDTILLCGETLLPIPFIMATQHLVISRVPFNDPVQAEVGGRTKRFPHKN
jgi:hypothetical protein